MTKTTPTPIPDFAIAVLECGFVYVGHMSLADGFLTITKARSIRKWGTTKGLGQLALSGPTTSTVMDECGDVFVPILKLVHLMEVSHEAWTP